MRPLMVSLCAQGLALFCAACSSAPTAPAPSKHTYRTPEVVAVVAPDSVAAGQRFEVGVIWINAGCETFSRWGTTTHGDTLALTPIVRDEAGSQCAEGPRAAQDFDSDIPAAREPRGVLYVKIRHAGPPIMVPVRVGSAAAAVRRFSVRLEDRLTGGPLAGANVRISGRWDEAEIGHLLAEGATGPDGAVELVRPCAASQFNFLCVDVVAPRVGWPDEALCCDRPCGTPQHMVFRVH
jgi:hypothetical protein